MIAKQLAHEFNEWFQATYRAVDMFTHLLDALTIGGAYWKVIGYHKLYKVMTVLIVMISND